MMGREDAIVSKQTCNSMICEGRSNVGEFNLQFCIPSFVSDFWSFVEP